MPIDEILIFRNTDSKEKKVAMLLALHSAPILKGIKIANLLTINDEDIRIVKELLKGTKIAYRLQQGKNKRVLLYLYRPVELRNYLFQESIQKFLKDYGYDGETLETMLDTLSEKLDLYRKGTEEFPHEIGVFLGYPLEDVEGFLINQGRNFLHVGYWKVYHNVEETIALFQRFDEERIRVIQEVITGKTIREIAV